MTRFIISSVENGETGRMETLEDVPRREDGEPVWPGDPDRHDAGAGDRIDFLLVPDAWRDQHGHPGTPYDA